MTLMKKCKNCGKKGLFLKLDDGLCNICSFKLSEEEFEKLKIRYSFDNIGIDEDILDLLWFYNGSHQNTTVQHVKKYITDNMTEETTIFEPSMIDLDLPIVIPPDDYDDSIPHHSPCYIYLDVYERYNYIQFLKAPYSGEHKLSYVFLFFYGLERHLYEGQFIKALNIIFKLRKVYNSKIFLKYTSEPLIYSLLLYKDKQLILDNFENLKECASLNALCVISVICHKPFTPEIIFEYRKDFLFKLDTYTKLYSELFISKIKECLIQTYQTDVLDLNKFTVNNPEIALKSVYLNWSLPKQPIPNIMSEKFYGEGLKILQYAHNAVKTHLKETKEYIKVPDTPAPDMQKLYYEYMKVRDQHYAKKEAYKNYGYKCSPYVGQHYFLQDLIPKIYKFRANPAIMEDIIKICWEDIEIFSHTNELDGYHSDSFYKLVNIYERRKNFETAIKVCDIAIDHHVMVNHDYEYYIRKKEIYLQKINGNKTLLPEFKKSENVNN